MRNTRISATAFLLLFWGLFIVYGTSIPFEFDAGSEAMARGWERAQKIPWRSTALGWPSRTDMLSNILLFIPLGFLGVLQAHSRKIRPLPAFLLAALASAGLSLSVEILQLFSANRTPSTMDLGMNLMGGMLGGLAGLLTAGRLIPRYRPLVLRWIRQRPLSSLALVVAFLVLFHAASPFDVSLDVDDLKASVKSARPIPFGDPIHAQPVADPALDLLAAFLAWSMAGAVASLAFLEMRLRPAPAIGAATAAATAVVLVSELGQLFIVSRVSDATTVLVALMAAALGSAAAVILGLRARQGLLIPGMLIWSVVLMLGYWSPWIFSIPKTSELSLWRVLPFICYFQRTDVYALADAFGQILAFIPLGALYRAKSPSTTGLGAALFAALLAGLLEAGQLFISQRVADLTDVLLAAAGAYLGCELLAWAMQQHRSLPADPPDARLADRMDPSETAGIGG